MILHYIRLHALFPLPPFLSSSKHKHTSLSCYVIKQLSAKMWKSHPHNPNKFNIWVMWERWSDRRFGIFNNAHTFDRLCYHFISEKWISSFNHIVVVVIDGYLTQIDFLWEYASSLYAIFYVLGGWRKTRATNHESFLPDIHLNPHKKFIFHFDQRWCVHEVSFNCRFHTSI